MAEKVTVRAECGACGGTGIYRGFAEPDGVGVVCLKCKGTGCEELTYTPFEARKRRNNVRSVRLSGGGFIATGIGPVGSSVSYEDFLAGRMPSK